MFLHGLMPSVIVGVQINFGGLEICMASAPVYVTELYPSVRLVRDCRMSQPMGGRATKLLGFVWLRGLQGVGSPL